MRSFSNPLLKKKTSKSGLPSSTKPNELDAELVFREDFVFGEHADQVYFIAAQLFSDVDGRPLGFLRLGYDELSVQEQINTAYHFGSLIASGYIVFSTLLAIFFGRRLIKPVSSLRSFATSIAAGDRTVELQVDTKIFELRRLAEDLQLMHRSLATKQQEILDRELRLEAILNHAGEGIVTIDNRGVVQSFNLAAETIFGYAAEEVIGQNVSILMPSRYDEKHDDYIRDYLRSGASKIIGTGRRVEAQQKDGHVVPIYLTISKVQQGEDISFTGIMHDLSAEERKEAELQQLSRAVEQSPVSILITNTEGIIEFPGKHQRRNIGVYGELSRKVGSGAVYSRIRRRVATCSGCRQRSVQSMIRQERLRTTFRLARTLRKRERRKVCWPRP
jgi:PAS domain S-box-containing protein